MSCYQKGNTHSSFYNLEYGDSVTVDNLDLSGRITLVGGYADAGGTKKDVYYFYLTFEGDTLKIDGMYIMDI